MNYLKALKLMGVRTLRWGFPVIAFCLIAAIPFGIIMAGLDRLGRTALGYSIIQLVVLAIVIVIASSFTVWFYWQIRSAFLRALHDIRNK